MSRYASLGNGKLLINLDGYGQVKDLYFHYAGLENHVSEHLVHKIGIWVDGKFSWLDDGAWTINIESDKETMATFIVCINSPLGIELNFSDVVYNEKNIFIREVVIKNNLKEKRMVKIFFNQQYNISQTTLGNTAFYDPESNSVIHYKGRRVFLSSLLGDQGGIKHFSCGLLMIEGKDGTYKDAEDGLLSENPIEHGQVDSVISYETEISAESDTKLFYWITVGKSLGRVRALNDYVKERSPQSIVKTTKDYWSAWLKNQNFSFYGLSPKIIDLFNRSLLIIRAHVNDNGSIIASGDSGMLQYGRDTYAYVWPRDGAFCATALAKVGDFNASRRFFEYCADIIDPGGYFLHKYRPDKALGSSWHPWYENGAEKLPIQEDGTAMVIISLWTYFELSKDLEFIESVYNRLIKSSAEFMSGYVDESTGLPKPSYDIWEMKYGVHTFTSSSIVAALNICGKFASLLGKEQNASKYYSVATRMRDSIMRFLYNPDKKTFHKLAIPREGKFIFEETLDISSVYGIYKFGVLKPDDEILKNSFDIFREKLDIKTDIGGVARFEGDFYCYSNGNIPGNPWIITTCWLTQYLLEFVKSESDLPDMVKRFNWVTDRAFPSGILPEQINPYTGESLSAAPLVWSHAEFVITVIEYLEKLEKLGISKAS